MRESGLRCVLVYMSRPLTKQMGCPVNGYDFFTNSEFNSAWLLENLASQFLTENSSTAVNSLSVFIKNNESSVKVDFIRHNYPILSPMVTVGKIRLFSLEDLAAMKLNAIANRGAKKDFFDIYALLSHFSLAELTAFFEEKYQTMNSFTVGKSLAYFDDAELEPDPISLMDISWQEIKTVITSKLRDAF